MPPTALALDPWAQRVCCCVQLRPFCSWSVPSSQHAAQSVLVSSLAAHLRLRLPTPTPAGYTINSSKVIFLRRRPQPRPPKGAVGASLCTVCTRHLQDVSLYCSLQCKLDAAAGVKHVSLRALATAGGPQAHGHTHSSGSSGGGAPGTPSHLAQSLRPGAGPFHPASDSDGM